MYSSFLCVVPKRTNEDNKRWTVNYLKPPSYCWFTDWMVCCINSWSSGHIGLSSIILNPLLCHSSLILSWMSWQTLVT
jgi:hypothetical protein